MITSSISMPNPVLGVSDDMSGVFSVAFRIAIDRKSRSYIISNIRIEITNPYIKSLYEKGIADLIMKVSCIPAYKTWTFVNPSEIKIGEHEIDILVEVESFLVISKDLGNYCDSSFNAIFNDTSFSLIKGDIIAVTGSQKIPVEKENEKASLGSIFRFSKIEKSLEEQTLHFDFDDDQIVIYYPMGSSEWDPITLLFDKNQGLPYTALSLYIIPALTEAYTIMAGEEATNFVERKWFLVLESLLQKSESSDDPFINAQNVIKTGLPINLAFEEILMVKNMKA